MKTEETKETSLKEWVISNFDKMDFRGLTLYSDTCNLYDKFRDEIWELLVDTSEAEGYSDIYGFLATFNKHYMPHDEKSFKNQIVWWYVETICNEILGED